MVAFGEIALISGSNPGTCTGVREDLEKFMFISSYFLLRRIHNAKLLKDLQKIALC